MCDNECISKGKCEHNEECYDDVCFTSEQSKVVEKLIAKAKETERAKTIDECIKLVGGNIKTIVGIVFDNSVPIHDRALGRMAKNKLIEELVEQLEQLKEQKNYD